jgi:Family of unknown function (DUF6232)
MTQLLYEAGDIRIARHVAHFSQTSYQIANIDSIRIVQQKKINFVAVLIAIAGALSLYFGMSEHEYDGAWFGVGLLALALLLQIVWPRRRYILVFKISSGDVEALTSSNLGLIDDVKAAIEGAFSAHKA